MPEYFQICPNNFQAGVGGCPLPPIPMLTYCFTVPLNNAHMGLGALGELQLRSRGTNSRSHTSFLFPISQSLRDTRFGGSLRWHCGPGLEKGKITFFSFNYNL